MRLDPGTSWLPLHQSVNSEWETKKSFHYLQSCLTDSSWINLIDLIQIIWHKIGKTRLLCNTEWVFLVYYLLLSTHLLSCTVLKVLHIYIRRRLITRGLWCRFWGQRRMQSINWVVSCEILTITLDIWFSYHPVSPNYGCLATLPTKADTGKSKVNSVKSSLQGDRTQDLLDQYPNALFWLLTCSWMSSEQTPGGCTCIYCSLSPWSFECHIRKDKSAIQMKVTLGNANLVIRRSSSDTVHIVVRTKWGTTTLNMDMRFVNKTDLTLVPLVFNLILADLPTLC